MSDSKNTTATESTVAGAPPTPAAPKRQGLELAQHTFGPLLNPIKATAQQWQCYTLNRYKTIKEVKTTRNIYPRFKGYESPDEDGDDDDYDFRDTDTDRLANNIRRTVRKIEEEMGLDDKTLQKCVRILKCDAMLEEVDDVCFFPNIYTLLNAFTDFLRVAASHSRCNRPDLVPHYTCIHRRSSILSLSYASL